VSSISFHAPGVPAPQGSKRVFRGRVVEQSKRVKPWRDVVTQCAAIAADAEGLLGPLTPPYAVDLWFHIPKPRTTRATHPVAPTIGDLDKLVRSSLDALTKSGLIQDDRFIIRISTAKAWAGVDGPGAIIRVTEVTS